MTELFNDIRSLYQFKSPCNELKNYIEFFSESCFEATKQVVGDHSFSIRMFKSWTPTFWINLGPSYDLVLNGIIHRIKPNSAVAVTRNVTSERVNHSSDHLFTVKFYPGALKHLMSIDQTKLNCGAVALQDLLPDSLLQKIRSADYFEQRVYLIEQYLLQQAAGKKVTDHYTYFVTETIALYNSNEMKFNVNELAFRRFTSSKALTRYFERVIGIGPKQYFESVRMRTALPSFLGDRKSFDPVKYGYYDKSHFYRCVANFTGERIAGQH